MEEIEQFPFDIDHYPEEITESPEQIYQFNENRKHWCGFIEAQQMMMMAKQKINYDEYVKIQREVSKEKEQILYGKQLTTESILKNKIGIIAITGGYCSGKRQFAKNLQRLENELSWRIHVHQLNKSEYGSIDEDQFLQHFFNFCESSHLKPGNTLVISVLPCEMNIKLYLEILLKHPKSSSFQILSILTKMNISNLFQDKNRQVAEKTFSFPIHGYSQCVVLDTYDQNEKEIASLESLVKTAIPEIEIVRSMSNIIHLSVAKDLMSFPRFQLAVNQFSLLKNAFFFLGKPPFSLLF